MKNVGVITHYYRNDNYGGNLQAYALPQFLNNNGLVAKQICYPFFGNYSGVSNKKRALDKIKKNPFKLFIYVYHRFCIYMGNIIHAHDLKMKNDVLNKRMEVCIKFQNEKIPHTIQVYNDLNISELNEEFDCFITGSDQVFNYTWFRAPFWLTFASKPKISYAASMAMNEIPNDKINFTKSALMSFNAIGVREQKTIKLLSEIVDKKIHLNIDPVFLLDKNDWDKISSNNLINRPYIFCYFLGNNPKERSFAKRLSEEKKIDIVSIPCYKTRFKLYDRKFGDINLMVPSPEDFVSLIKNSEFVITDSFHACAFALMYNKKFLVFDRDKNSSMSSRIVSLMECFHTEKHYVKDEIDLSNELIEFIENNSNYESKEFDEILKQSKEYLLSNLK